MRDCRFHGPDFAKKHWTAEQWASSGDPADGYEYSIGVTVAQKKAKPDVDRLPCLKKVFSLI